MNIMRQGVSFKANRLVLISALFLLAGYYGEAQQQNEKVLSPTETVGAPNSEVPKRNVPSEMSSPAKPGLKQQESSVYYLCKSSAMARTLRVSYSGGRCVATYTKNGVDEIVGRSSVYERCFQVIQNIRDNLEKAKWICKDISESRVSLSEK